MKVLYSFNKRGYEAEFWGREIAAASNDEIRFEPFNHDPYLDPQRYIRAQMLDELYFDRHPGLMRLYSDVDERVRDDGIDAIIVDNCPPYHPDWLRKLPAYKVLRTSDGPVCAYDRDFAYVHAYDHIVYHSPAYSRDLDMETKLRYVGARNVDFVPLGLFDAAFEPETEEDALFSSPRDVEVVYIGAQHVGKMSMLAKVKNALGPRCRMHGLSSLKRNLYFNLKYKIPGWIHPIPFEGYVPLYRRSRIGFNLHNRGMYSVGNFRLFELPANGVMQISDGGDCLDQFFEVGDEIVSYDSTDDLVDKIRYYLVHDAERKRIARNGYRRVTRDYRFGQLLLTMGHRIGTCLRGA